MVQNILKLKEKETIQLPSWLHDKKDPHSVHKFDFNAIRRHTFFNIVSKHVQFWIKKGVWNASTKPWILLF